MLRDLQEKINSQEISLTSEKLKLALSDQEKQRDGSQALFKEREHRVEQVSEKLSNTERESEAVLSVWSKKKKGVRRMERRENSLFSHWKSETENS